MLGIGTSGGIAIQMRKFALLAYNSYISQILLWILKPWYVHKEMWVGMKPRSVSSSLNRFVFPFAFVALIVTLGFWYQSTVNFYQQESTRVLIEHMESHTASESWLFRQAQDSVERLHIELSERLEKIEPAKAEAEFYQKFARSEDGIWRVKEAYDDHVKLPSLYIQYDAELSPSLFVRAVASYGLLAERGPAIIPPNYSVYMDFVEKGLMVYSPFVNWGKGATRETDNFNYPTMVGSDPTNNPDREGFWTPAYFDEEARTWMVSVIEPLDWRGEWIGTVGHDVALDGLIANTQVPDIEGTYDFVLSTEGKLLAHPAFTEQINDAKGNLSIAELGDPILLRAQEMVRQAKKFPTVVEDDEQPYLYGVAKLEGPEMLFVTVYPKSLIEDRALEAIFYPVVLGLLAIVVAFLILRAGMNRLVIIPLGHLDDAVVKLSGGQTNLDIPIKDENEFGRLARSFENLSLELQRSGDSLELAQQDWQRTFDTVLEYILIMDKNFVVKRANKAFYSTFSATPEDVIGMHRRDLLAEEHRNMFEEFSKSIVESKEATQFSAYAAGANVNVEVVIAPLFDDQKQVIGIVEVGRNVTEQRLLEEQLRQSQKMDAVGQLAGGVAHDFNNLLQIILGYAENLEQELEGDSREGVEQIITAGTKAAALTQQLLAFSRRQVMQASPLTVTEVIRSTLELVKRLIESNVQIKFETPTEALTVNGDLNLLEQVLINLCLNARDAMPDGGTLELGASRADELPEALAGNSLGYARLWVKDTGHGIEQENQDRIFEPFFSTKEMNKGTGLGLATAYGIIEQHRGIIAVESSPGEGATFSVYLPLIESEQTSILNLQSETETQTGGGCILIAEDDVMIRDLLKLMLVKAGYEVIAATDGVEALQLYKANAERIQLLILDVMMPGLSGDKALALIRETNPNIPCLIASGYSDDSGLIDQMDGNITTFISKPFKRDVLLTEVKQLLES